MGIVPFFAAGTLFHFFVYQSTYARTPFAAEPLYTYFILLKIHVGIFLESDAIWYLILKVVNGHLVCHE